ncbi:peptide chain release factor aRF-1 [Candidatus Pacearchaeota archaeon]|nr:peptide chain release factor aRF-1 [Candidatus Pacearchaeota archaeon]
MQESEKIKLESFIEDVGKHKGRHTELVTVYIPAGYNLNNVTRQIEQEKSTASNIKSKNTRKAVLDSLEKIERQLKLIGRTPENGLAVFAGNISETEGVEQIELWTIEPPMPLKARLYRCDQDFVLEPLKEMLEVGELYGLLVIDRKDATIGLLEGKQIKVLKKLTSGVPSKVRAGGQSSQRFARITEGLAKEFFRRVAEHMKEIFFDMPKLKGILVGGPMPTKDDFLEQGNLATTLKEKVVAVKDLGYVDEHGLKLLVEASSEDLAEQEIIKEKKLLEKFFNVLAKNPSRVAYGLSEVKNALQKGAVETLILSKKLAKEHIIEMTRMAGDIAAKVEIVSVETPEGEQFYSITKGFGAILRFVI